MMPLHRRPNAQGRKSAEGEGKADDDYESVDKQRGHPMSLNSQLFKLRHRKFLTIASLSALQWILLVLVAINVRIRSSSHLFALLTTAWIASLPIFLILAVGLGGFSGPATSTATAIATSTQDLPHQRYIPLAIVATIVGNQLPSILSSGIAAVAMAIFGLSSRPLPNTSSNPPPPHHGTSQPSRRFISSGPINAVLGVLLLTAVMLTENFFIWVVSATYKASQDLSHLPDPLQDNGQIVLRYFFNNILELTKRDIVKLRNVINVEWILVSGMGLSLVAIEMQGGRMKRNMWGLALRAVLTLAMARSIRTISFLITVLPSQNPRCYFGHFPYPPPKDWGTWFMTGFIPQANGGCNDLIISGHATVTSTLACVVTSVVDKPLFSMAIWMFVAIDYMVEVYEGFHYSVDMWLGAILVNFIWSVLSFIENTAEEQQSQTAASTRQSDSKQFYKLSDATKSDWIKYAFPVTMSYIQVTGILIPKEYANYMILAFVVATVYQIATSGFQHYTQHCLFSLLYLALGIYL